MWGRLFAMLLAMLPTCAPIANRRKLRSLEDILRPAMRVT
jgi:hypothetical protein